VQHFVPTPPSGRVYFARATDGLIKIGVTGNLQMRIRGLRRECGEVPELLVAIRGWHRLEGELHGHFWSARVRSEWHRPVPELLAFVDVARGTTPLPAASLRAGQRLTWWRLLNDVAVDSFACRVGLSYLDALWLEEGRLHPTPAVAARIAEQTGGLVAVDSWGLSPLGPAPHRFDARCDSQPTA
jgi:hypothetical protein